MGDPLRRRIAGYSFKTLRWGERRVPPGGRALIGALLMVGGLFGFLPVLGFWMLPLGLAFVALDVPPARRRMRGWMERLREQAEG